MKRDFRHMVSRAEADADICSSEVVLAPSALPLRLCMKLSVPTLFHAKAQSTTPARRYPYPQRLSGARSLRDLPAFPESCLRIETRTEQSGPIRLTKIP